MEEHRDDNGTISTARPSPATQSAHAPTAFPHDEMWLRLLPQGYAV